MTTPKRYTTRIVKVQTRVVPAEAKDAMSHSTRARIGKWIWVLLLGADVAYETLSFLDGAQGFPTLSQLVKRGERAGGIVASIAVFCALIGVCVTLIFHWVFQTF